MSEEVMEAIDNIKEFIENDEIQSISIFDLQKVLNYIDKLQKELKDSINARFELQRRIDKQEKIIDSLAQWVSNLSPMVDKQVVKDIIYKENKDE